MNTPYYYCYILYKYYNTLLACLLLTSTTVLYAQENQQVINEYILKGGKENALILYEKKIREGDQTSDTHNGYLKLILSMGKYREAERYVRKRIQREGLKTPYFLDLGLIALKEGKNKKADMIFRSAIKKHGKVSNTSRNMLNYFVAHRLFDYAINTIMVAREDTSNPLLYAYDMGYLYRIKNNKRAMIEEYLNLLANNANNIHYIKNIFRTTLKEKEDLNTLEDVLYERVQGQPAFEPYLDLLIWTNLQNHNFYGAYVKAKAYDKRFGKDKTKTLEVARIALSNGDFDTAEKGFNEAAQQSGPSSFYNNRIKARLGYIKAMTARMNKIQGVGKKDSIRLLVEKYQSLIEEYPNRPEIAEAIFDQAKLYAYQLNEEGRAINELNQLIKRSTVNAFTKAKAKLELGTLYMIQGQPWESTLLYGQVAREQQGTPIGYEAKLRSAKLHYYKGDFKLAQEQLDILKEATTKKIANDALELSLRIKENTLTDSTGARLKEYATVERLLAEHQTDQALKQLITIKEECEAGVNEGNFEDRALLDDVLWLEAKIRLQRNEWEKAYELLQQIVTRFDKDVLADDALFLQGEIAENHQQKDKATEHYLTLINQFSGSIYADEARKRYRKLKNNLTLEPMQ